MHRKLLSLFISVAIYKIIPSVFSFFYLSSYTFFNVCLNACRVLSIFFIYFYYIFANRFYNVFLYLSVGWVVVIYFARKSTRDFSSISSIIFEIECIPFLHNIACSKYYFNYRQAINLSRKFYANDQSQACRSEYPQLGINSNAIIIEC